MISSSALPFVELTFIYDLSSALPFAGQLASWVLPFLLSWSTCC
jgi:hypothetical protein